MSRRAVAEAKAKAENDYAARMDSMRVLLAQARLIGAWDGYSSSRAVDFLHGLGRFSMGELIEIASDAAFAEIDEPSEIH